MNIEGTNNKLLYLPLFWNLWLYIPSKGQHCQDGLLMITYSKKQNLTVRFVYVPVGEFMKIDE